MKILHVITDLEPDGAQAMLYKLISYIDHSAFESEVVSLIGNGSMSKELRALGVSVRSLGMRRGVPNPFAVAKLARWLREDPPQVVQTWMHHADLVGGLAARVGSNSPVAWGIQMSNLDPQTSKRMTIWTAKACASLSRWLPARIVCCSFASREVHAQMGYAAEKMMVIPNAFDLQAYRPDPAARRSVRKELKIPANSLLIGLFARFDPQKDHHNFIQAASLLLKLVPDAYFILSGSEIAWDNLELTRWIDSAGIRDRCRLLGWRGDIARLSAALDVASTSSSYGEGLPNVIGEAMACEVPCVVTDVGDSRLVVGDSGITVPPRDPKALAAAWGQLLLGMSREERVRLGTKARQRISERYDVMKIVHQYERLYRSLMPVSELSPN